MKRRLTLVAMCSLMTVWTPGFAEEAPVDTKPVDGQPVEAAAADGLNGNQREFWQGFQADADVQLDALGAEAEQWYLKARALLAKAHFVEAREAVEEAITINPGHADAQELRQDILAILSQRDDRLQMAASWLASMRDVAVQEQAVRMARLLAAGERQMAAGEFKEAFLNFDRVAIGLRSFPYQFDWGNLPDEVEAKKLQAQARARDAALARDAAVRKRADQEARLRSDLEEQALELKVNEILRRAKEQFDREHYRRASIDAWNAYQLDRRREDARKLYLEARRRGHVQFDSHIREEKKERLARLNENIHRDLIPQSELLVFPEDWFRRSLRQPEELTESAEEPWRRDLLNRLEQEVSFVWEENSMEEVIDFLRRTTGVNFVIAREVYADANVPPITLSGTMRLKTVLNWIQQLTRLQMAIRNEAIYFSTDEVEGDVVVRLYSITDLISPVIDFPGPELAYNQSGGDAGGGGFDLFGDAGGFDNDTESLDAGQIEEFITQSVAPDTWDLEGVAIQVRQGGTLFISQTPEVHGLIAELLQGLRNQASLEVKVQIRVLDVTKSFIEEIGVEWNDFQNDVISNPYTTQGFLDVNNEWGYAVASSNNMPGNAAQTGFANGFGNGLRTEYIFGEGNSILDLRTVNVALEALEQEADANVLNAPELTCFNGQRAHATFIEQYAYIEDYEVSAGGNYDPVISVINFGDIIDIRPYVSADRKYVTLEVRPSSVLLQGVYTENIVAQRIAGRGAGSGGVVFTNNYPLELPTLEVRTLRTTVMLPDKGSLMLGGYIRGLRQRTHSGIPFLSHIPFLGRLFSKNGIYDENRHLMFMVTAEIIDLGEREALQ
ncbi:MAG: hypothetical protein PF961_06515 [Planctomycetota bacterium]|jgi:tetratricopeptide (TPR) repeat protein|nr:hypothetical protein [Planctomycetota bacterium]